MARTVIGLFQHPAEVESAMGAFRAAGFPNRVLRVTKPGETATFESSAEEEAAEQHRTGWFREHLPHLGRAHEQVKVERLTETPHLLSVLVSTDVEERDARTLMVTAGALQISNTTDGRLVTVQRIADGVAR